MKTIRQIIITLFSLIMALNGNGQEWLNTEEYPFKSHYFQTQSGKQHYIDEGEGEGEGEVLLFVHGTPTWSFL